MECPAAEYAVQTASQTTAAWPRVWTMADPRNIAPAVDSFPQPWSAAETGVLLTQVDFDALVRELETLRSTHRNEVARRLREARAFGGSTENDDLLAVAEDTAFDQARIAQLEELVRLASVVEHAAADDGAGLGSTVRVADEAGRATEYMLIGRRDDESCRNEVTIASPVGKALWGARSGDVVHVTLPNGRARTLRVLDVRHDSLPGATVTLDGAARAA
ncbi:MAG TPA: GreA/GreB family elongation factor [Solirubrobacteraceae bacterium]|nr:GreA/GreB family elongation factor [Solirubrobacteraceae bacterium]